MPGVARIREREEHAGIDEQRHSATAFSERRGPFRSARALLEQQLLVPLGGVRVAAGVSSRKRRQRARDPALRDIFGERLADDRRRRFALPRRVQLQIALERFWNENRRPLHMTYAITCIN